ncbi:unnamed protein product, partial [Polarella glacialis]
VSSYFEELHFLMEKVNQPILGVAFGHLGPLGTRLVRSCDVVWAQTTATFSTNEIGLDIPAHRAELAGLVIKQVFTAAQLGSECMAWARELAKLDVTQLLSVKIDLVSQKVVAESIFKADSEAVRAISTSPDSDKDFRYRTCSTDLEEELPTIWEDATDDDEE